MALRLAGDREECDFVRYGSSPFSVHSMDTTRCYVEVPPWLPTGTTPVNYVLNWGAFESDNVMMVHGVYVDDHDVAKLKEYDVSVASCPRINAQLGMGVAPLAEFSEQRPARGPGHRQSRRHRLHRHDLGDAHRHAHSARREPAQLHEVLHHAGDGHHRRRPRAAHG